MLTSNHYISLYVNNQLIDLEDQGSLNLRMNDVLFDPENTKTSQATYSFTFKVPATENNNKIFGFANAIDQNNKFNKRYDALVYSDETLIFNGSMVVKEYSHQDKAYSCNLVNIKIYSLDEIFGDEKLSDLNWEVDFDGASSINAVNEDGSTKYFFPLVSYGVFQKEPYYTDEVGNEYTSKFVFDSYNKWWVETFYPSLNVLELMKKAFEEKGFNVMGTAFADPVISNVYTSVNLSSEQAPTYNLGNPRFGLLHCTVDFSNSGNTENMWQQDLSFPYLRVDPTSNQNATTKYNLATVDIWNILKDGDIREMNEQYLYDPNESLIVIPADGWYKIELLAELYLDEYESGFTAMNYYNSGDCEDEIRKRSLFYLKDFSEDTPLEIHLVKNYDFNAELIKGKKNVRFLSGDRNDTSFYQSGCGYTSNTVPNRIDWLTEFPHQELYSAYPPTETNAILTTSVGQTTTRSGRNVNDATYGGISESAPSSLRTRTRPRPLTASTVGYMTKNGSTMPYDPAVSEAFICGFSTFCNGISSVMKNGNSWSNLNTITNEIFSRVDGLDFVDTGGTSSTTYCANEFIASPRNFCTADGDSLIGHLYCSVYLHKNDQLELLAIQRNFGNEVQYTINGAVQLFLEASSPATKEELKADGYSYFTPTAWNDKLELNHWINDEVLTKDWIENILTAFNLQLTQRGNDIIIDTNRGLRKNVTNAIDIDDRASEDEAVTSIIEYPSSMKVTYKVDKDEWGFEKSVPPEYINLKDWYKYGNSGYTVVKMSNDIYTTKENNTTTDFSYCWYDGFTFSGSNNDKMVSIPVISKYEYMIDGFNYDEAMQYDGYSLTQRFWFRQPPSEDTIDLSSYQNETIYLTYPTNVYQTVNLSYKDTEKSLLTEYFNFVPMLSSNYVEIEVYLNPDEYKMIKMGAKVKYCTDTYYVSEIEGFDPSGNNPTTLKLIKAVN